MEERYSERVANKAVYRDYTITRLDPYGFWHIGEDLNNQFTSLDEAEKAVDQQIANVQTSKRRNRS